MIPYPLSQISDLSRTWRVEAAAYCIPQEQLSRDTDFLKQLGRHSEKKKHLSFHLFSQNITKQNIFYKLWKKIENHNYNEMFSPPYPFGRLRKVKWEGVEDQVLWKTICNFDLILMRRNQSRCHQNRRKDDYLNSDWAIGEWRCILKQSSFNKRIIFLRCLS